MEVGSSGNLRGYIKNGYAPPYLVSNYVPRHLVVVHPSIIL